MEVCCSFKSIVGGMCGFDTRDRKKETQIIPLLACLKAISNHTASLGFSGPMDEVDLILSRAAVFTQPANINSMTICPLHREKLGLSWRRGSTARCRVPEALSNHDRRRKKWPKFDRGIGKIDSQIILKKTGVFLQIGSGKFAFCKLCFTVVTSLRFLKNIDFKFKPLTLIFLGIWAFCRKTLRLLVAEEKESSAIVSSTSRSTDASVLMQMENLNLVSFDPHYAIYSQLAFCHPVKYQAKHTMQVLPIQSVCLHNVRGDL